MKYPLSTRKDFFFWNNDPNYPYQRDIIFFSMPIQDALALERGQDLRDSLAGREPLLHDAISWIVGQDPEIQRLTEGWGSYTVIIKLSFNADDFIVEVWDCF